MSYSKNYNINNILKCGKRSFRTMPDKLLLGSTGARLWADSIEARPGFWGRIDFIHKTNIPGIFSVICDATDSFEPCNFEWYPSHLVMKYNNSRISFTEYKYITWDDCAVSCQRWENKSSETVSIELILSEYLTENNISRNIEGIVSGEGHDYQIKVIIDLGDIWENGIIKIEPGAYVSFIIIAAFGQANVDDDGSLIERIARIGKVNNNLEDILSKQVKEYENWFAKAPVFISSDPLIDKTWAYRWYILRHNLSVPGFGYLKNPYFCEGRSYKMEKQPYRTGGWEFSKMVNLSVPMHIIDARWYHDYSYCIGELDNLIKGQDESGLYRSLYADKALDKSYANFTGWAAYQYYLISKDDEILNTVLPSLKKQIKGWQNILGSKEDSLIIERTPSLTGKEYQPSYWYFNDFPDDPKDKSMVTPLKRVDRTVYHYMNVLGVANLSKICGDDDYEYYKELASKIKKDVLDLMWDDKTQFFYDLHYQTSEKAMVKNIVGFYPYWGQMTEEEHNVGFERLFSKDFSTKCPFPSVSTDNPIFAPSGGWKGRYIKGRNGCIWNGPTWPYTNSVILDALANQSRALEHKYDKEFRRYFREYSFMHFDKRDLEKPYLVEHYDSNSGEPLSDEPDYNHSYYIDLVIRNIVGLQIGEDSYSLDPIDIGLDYFILDNIILGGKKLCITYKNPNISVDKYKVEDGYNLYIDGERLCHLKTLSKAEYIKQPV